MPAQKVDKDYKSVLALIGDIYEAAIDPAHWTVVLERLAELMRSKSAILVIHDREGKQFRCVHAYNVPRVIQGFLNSPMGALDPGLKVMRGQPTGKAVNMYRLDDPDVVPRMLQGLISRFTDAFYFGGINCFNDESQHAGIGLHRTRDIGPYEPETLELLDDLYPHLQRALRIQKEFIRLKLREKALRVELDRHIMGLVLLNEQGESLYMNPMARRILAQHGALSRQNGRLRAHSRTENEQLQRAIRESAALPNVSSGHAFGLSHPDFPMPLAVLVTPSAPGQAAEGFPENRARVAVYITDPDSSAPIAGDSLMEIYGLTEREARVAVAIVNGLEPGRIAELDGVSVQTVRSQLKSVFAKTGVNRQADLIRLLLTGPLTYAGGEGKKEVSPA